MSPLSHLNSWILTKCNLCLANSLAAVVREPDLCRLLTFQVPNLLSLFHCLGCTKVSVQFQVMCLCFVSASFYFEKLSAPHPTPKQLDHPFFLSATTYPTSSQLPSILESVSPSTAQGHAMPWWQGPPYGLKWCYYLKCSFLRQFILHLCGCFPVNILFIHIV